MAVVKSNKPSGAQAVAKVLLVDDDAENLSALQGALESDGHEVAVARDASAAMAILNGAPIQCVVTDLEMPGTDGAQFSRQIRTHPVHRDLPIVMLSAAPEPSVDGVRYWTHFIRKPASFARLAAAVAAEAGTRAGTHAASPRPKSGVLARVALQCQTPCASRWQPVHAASWP
ncbi:response regulator [Paraburkholderia edwinii]|uniref:Response regulator n=1 Tax=Paraburkholderia edwinii TaxID=2861782 RepID=A0ABX8URT0_9BURK|nr:response regulator [Paraburkholderia edwinii]